METNQSYKNRALATLEGKWTTAAIASLIYLIISEGVIWMITTLMGMDSSTASGIELIWTILCLPLGWGISIFFLNMVRNANPSYESLFDGYKDFARIFLAGFLVVSASLIGCLFFIVPGIIVGLMFSQTDYILKDNKELGAIDAIKKSVEMMKGHKMELFWLMLSFIGWFILCVLTVGIGFLLFQPYFETTLSHYYEDLKKESF